MAGHMELVTIALLALAATQQPALQARFIGNSGFEITDGTATILIDFPYRSGSFGYMTFSAAEVHERPGSLCLFTHSHADHFDPKAIGEVGCSVAGTQEVLSAVPESARAGPGPTWSFRGAEIRCVPTQHTVEHCSYFVRWHGVSFFISGDIEDLSPLAGWPKDLDAAFLASWLLPELERQRPSGFSARIVVHHHTADEKLRPCDSCLVPTQGGRFDLEAVNGGAR